MICQSSKAHNFHVRVKVKYNDTSNFCLFSTAVAKTLETAYPEEEIRDSTAAGCSEHVLSARTSTTPCKMLLIIARLQTFLKQPGVTPNTRKKKVSIHGKPSQVSSCGQGSKERNSRRATKMIQGLEHLCCESWGWPASSPRRPYCRLSALEEGL